MRGSVYLSLLTTLSVVAHSIHNVLTVQYFLRSTPLIMLEYLSRNE